MRDHDRKLFLASLTDRYVKRQIDRRSFLRSAGQLGLGLGAFGLGVTRPFGGHFTPVAHAQDLRPDPDVLAWVREVSKPFAGTTLKLATESTPPSNALNSQLKQYFEEASGIKVEIEVLPLEQVLQKLTLDIASQLGTYDLYYIDQSWAASVSRDVFDPREQYAAKPDLAMPNWNIDDFLPALVDGICVYEDRWVGVPYDIPIFIMMYRRDIYEQLGMSAPTTFEEYLRQAQRISAETDLYGATGQMKSGHYSLECDWTAWLWGHGGSIFNADRKFSGNDELGLEAMAYWDQLYKTMPPGVTTWTWDGQGQSIAQGVAATMMSWGEFFPYFDDPSATKVSGLMEAVRCPAPVRSLRTVEETGFGEIPGVGHQGGSSLAVSMNSKAPDAAWIFMQWVTCQDTQVLITTLGGGTGPTRNSVYDDPRVIANNRVGPGTTRHLNVVRETIAKDMGSEPDLPEWAELSNDTIPVRLGKYFAGDYGSAKEAMDDIAKAVDGIVRS
ncbi:ABC transporter substrate-binding protein [Rubrimonas cliftonensis]|uniref:Carbohydrate ABC transporter substrate-binding protein, CUT1 family n=1 Tax=Rubrimonas cliftonensis TaxID=89524 RepID=A0A1H4DIU7_9RHOB|nr:extracellular solute-binding protein [Rubrimonas cliftonensis]SEA72458.1 carbohydrate ABC transporter substrate-binding protein, CUT1 family [Rubrimonas cliftonensis]